MIDYNDNLLTKEESEKSIIINDPVNHPSHYTAGGIECIDAIAAALTSQSDPMSAWLTGQCLKYLWRWPLKNGLEDLKKTRFYLDRLIKHDLRKFYYGIEVGLPL